MLIPQSQPQYFQPLGLPFVGAESRRREWIKKLRSSGIELVVGIDLLINFPDYQTINFLCRGETEGERFFLIIRFDRFKEREDLLHVLYFSRKARPE